MVYNNNICLEIYAYYFVCRISQAVENIPRLFADKDKYSQSSQMIVMETRSFPRQKFNGMQCSRLDLKMDPTVHRMVPTPDGYVFVCVEMNTKSNQLSYIELVRTGILCNMYLCQEPI